MRWRGGEEGENAFSLGHVSKSSGPTNPTGWGLYVSKRMYVCMYSLFWEEDTANVMSMMMTASWVPCLSVCMYT